MKKAERIHPAVLDAQSSLRGGRMSRREFLRFATLLGASATTAYVLAACSPGATSSSGQGSALAAAATATPALTRGGRWTSAMQLQKIDHPARLSWQQGSNVVRQVNEYLTEVGPDNLTRPWLLERWQASDDVKEWTFHLRKDVLFNNGAPLTADDVIFTFGEWLKPDVGSSMLSQLSYLGGPQNIEKVDDYTIKFHFIEPSISFPEDVNQYPAVILPRTFEGDWVKSPVGSGAFTLTEYAEGERAAFAARKDYYRQGQDGLPLPYLDTLTYVSLDHDAAVAALLAGQVDTMYNPTASDWEALKDNEALTVRAARTAQVLVGRMRVDLEPWTDMRVRTALKLCQDRQKILDLAYKGQGDLALDAHVAPVHPEFAGRPIPPYDPDAARKLLEEYAAEKGVTLPLKVTLATKNDEGEDLIAQALKEMAAPAGFDMSLDITDANGYWDRWTEVPLGITAWAHRPLATMALAAGYTVDADGKPVAWNESRFNDSEFNDLLREAQRTLDVDDRRVIMGKIEDVFQERGPVFISFWKNIWNITNSSFQNVQAHPTSYDILTEVWKQQ